MSKKQQPSWGRVTGLLAACLATLIGIWHRIEPEEILLRAVVAGVAIMIFTNLVGLMITPSRKRRSHQ